MILHQHIPGLKDNKVVQAFNQITFIAENK